MLTATEIMMRERERHHQDRVRRVHREFLDTFAPSDAEARSEFGAQLSALLREAVIEALKPFQNAAAAQLARSSVPPVVLRADNKKEARK